MPLMGRQTRVNTQLPSGLQLLHLPAAIANNARHQWSNTIFASNGNGTILEYKLSTVIPCRLRETCRRDPELNLSPTNTLTPEAIIPGTPGVAQPATVFIAVLPAGPPPLGAAPSTWKRTAVTGPDPGTAGLGRTRPADPHPYSRKSTSTEQDKQWRIQSGGNADQSPV
jgi:hypothetical protein